jgi:RHS repeat-associated protein
VDINYINNYYWVRFVAVERKAVASKAIPCVSSAINGDGISLDSIVRHYFGFGNRAKMNGTVPESGGDVRPLSGNRVAAQENNQTRTTSYNNLNQMTGINHGGSTWLRGHVDEPANVTVNGQNARVYEDGTFESLTNVGPGAQTINVQATDTNGNTTTQNWQVNNGPASGAVPTHDIEGNLLTDGTYTYTWDARNRMTSVTKGSDTWSFAYDGQNRRISESKNGSLVRQFIWNGTRVMEERIEPQISGQGLLTRRYWTGGVEMAEAGIDPQANFYLHDHLGSLRVVVGDDGTNQIAAVASYDYSPWGQRSELTGTTNSPHSLGYTGHWWHESGLSLAVYRPYDPLAGRWPSRDPIGERGGFNLYRMVENDLLNRFDLLGLVSVEFSPANENPGFTDHNWRGVDAPAETKYKGGADCQCKCDNGDPFSPWKLKCNAWLEAEVHRYLRFPIHSVYPRESWDSIYAHEQQHIRARNEEIEAKMFWAVADILPEYENKLACNENADEAYKRLNKIFERLMAGTLSPPHLGQIPKPGQDPVWPTQPPPPKKG